MEFVTSQQGIDRIKKFEFCRLTAYQDSSRSMDDWLWTYRQCICGDADIAGTGRGFIEGRLKKIRSSSESICDRCTDAGQV